MKHPLNLQHISSPSESTSLDNNLRGFGQWVVNGFKRFYCRIGLILQAYKSVRWDIDR